MLAEYSKLSREAADADEGYEQYLLRLTELEVAAPLGQRPGGAGQCGRVPGAQGPGHLRLQRDALPEQAEGAGAEPRPVDRRAGNACFIGNAGTGKTHLPVALGQAACRAGKRVRFYTAAALVNQLEEAQKQYRLERLLAALAKADLLIVDELGYLSFSRSGAELLFQVFADRYECGSILITSNLPFGVWATVFQGERMTAALLDRFTHRCSIFEMNGEIYRFRESAKAKGATTGPVAAETKTD